MGDDAYYCGEWPVTMDSCSEQKFSHATSELAIWAMLGLLPWQSEAEAAFADIILFGQSLPNFLPDSLANFCLQKFCSESGACIVSRVIDYRLRFVRLSVCDARIRM